MFIIVLLFVKAFVASVFPFLNEEFFVNESKNSIFLSVIYDAWSFSEKI